MTLRVVGSGLRSGQRNTELVLLAASALFAVLAWRALDRAGFDLPAGSGRILAQFLAVAFGAHVALRLAAPAAAPQPLAVALLLCAVGLAFVTRLAPAVAQDQVNWITLGLALMVVVAASSRLYPRLRGLTYTSAAAAIATLVATGLFGDTINGARLWITVAGRTVQTTELIKLFLIVFLAGYLADKASVLAMPRFRLGGREYSALPYLVPLALTWLAAVLALGLLKDLGSIALLVLLAVSVTYVATGRARYLVVGAVLLALTGAAGYVAFDHARTRIDVWRDPFAHENTAGYQTVQSLYAFEAGGITGEGLGRGEPGVIPAAPTDYIFSAIGEELGLAGAAGVVMLYGAFVVAGLRVAATARDDFSRLLVCCVALLIGIQAAVIIGGNLRLIPTTGITLPFVSYGGSSLVVNFALLGLLLGVSDRAARR